eukprot:CAMPEP_0182579740 /NCGR_PEP_ID=MMETSP1324-20130603/44922_1 /TAXON_ID=236786 /ORGANISM="Florenciella sp., Strain RCC1587" /LENGTH=41 /DNA_ID= /DNA_START= /DNA_END= /DNA_ORIENTATION=
MVGGLRVHGLEEGHGAISEEVVRGVGADLGTPEEADAEDAR